MSWQPKVSRIPVIGVLTVYVLVPYPWYLEYLTLVSTCTIPEYMTPVSTWLRDPEYHTCPSKYSTTIPSHEYSTIIPEYHHIIPSKESIPAKHLPILQQASAWVSSYPIIVPSLYDTHHMSSSILPTYQWERTYPEYIPMHGIQSIIALEYLDQ